MSHTVKNMKLIDVDKFLKLMVKGYIKNYVNVKSKAEMVFNAWTLYERNTMTMIEFFITIELLCPLTEIKYDVPGKTKALTLTKEQFYTLVGEKVPHQGTLTMHQFLEIVNATNLFTSGTRNLFRNVPMKGEPHVG